MKLDLERLRRSRLARDVLGVVLAVAAVCGFLALVSFRGTDPSWFRSDGGPAGGENWMGWLGATGAEALLQVLGATAFLVPPYLAAVAWRRLRGRPVRGARAAGPWIMGLALSAMLDLLYGPISYGGGTFPRPGGYVGEKLARILVALLNFPGALVVSATVVAATLILTRRASFARTIELSGRWLAAGRARLLAAVSEWRRSRERPAVEATRIVAEPPPEPLGPRPPAPSVARKITVPVREKPAPAKDAQRPLPMEPGKRGYSLPGLDLLQEPEPQAIESEQELLERARQITEKFREFSVDGNVVAIHPGPVVTTFEFKPEAGVKYSKITGMHEDLSLALRAESVRIDRMPGRSTVGIEVPNRRQETIYPRDLFASEKYQHTKSKLPLALGKDISGHVFVAELERMPHLLIAGATGSGKSVGLNGMIASILYKASPLDVRFIMIDTKMIELGVYADIPHLLIPVVTEAKKASNALKWAVREMEVRYRKLAALGVRNIAQFNDRLEQKPDCAMEDAAGQPVPLDKMPYIVIVIDELADLLLVASADVEESIMRLAQMARAVGIHLIIATQRPSVDVITGTIKANFPSRIAFRVSQRVDSRTIIDQQGAEHLLGRGDMLFLSSGSSRLIRVHGSLFTEAELHRITSFLKKVGQPVYDESVLREPDPAGAGPDGVGDRDEMYVAAVRTVVQEGKCSITLLQRRLQLGYARAARIVDMMEREGVVSPGEGSKPRDVLVRPDALEELETRL